MTDKDRFLDRLREIDIDPGGELVESKVTRATCSCKPKKRGKDGNGWYLYYADEPATLTWGCWNTDCQNAKGGKLSAKSEKTLTPAERKIIKTRIETERKAREEERLRVEDATRKKTARLWKSGRKVAADHPYIVKKGVRPVDAKQVKNMLVIPMSKTGTGEPESLQLIFPDSSKRFLIGTGAIPGPLYHAIKGNIGGPLYIVEGWATGCSVHEATGESVVIAFSSGRLPAVAEVLKGRFPGREIVIAGDQGNGCGKAIEAARKIGGKVVFPAMPDGIEGTDFNDLYQAAGLEEVARQLATAATPATSTPSTTTENPGDQWPNPHENKEPTPQKKPKPKPMPSTEAGDQGALPVSAFADMFTDMRMAATFAQMFRPEIRYWPETGKWLIFDGRRWTTDAPGGAFPFVRRLIEVLYQRAMGYGDFTQRSDMLKAILKIEAHPRQETILAAARNRPEIIVTSSDLDQHQMLLTVHNGTIDLQTGQLQPSRAEDFMTRFVPIEFDLEATCPLWINFLGRIFDADQEVIDYLQRFAGYCLTGLTGEQVLLFLYGLGCNGKSVLANVLGALLGDYSSTAGADLLMIRENRSATNDIAALRGARLVKVSEFDDGERLAEAQIKTLTGGDPVTCRFLYQEHFTYTPTFKVLLIGNHKPKIRGTDHGIWRRLHLLHFRVTIPEEERDPHLQDKLMTELPGILAWAVQGCLEWQTGGLRPPAEVKAAVDEYRQGEDIFQQWLDDCCTLGNNLATLASSLLDSFIQHSRWKGTTPQKLGRMLTEAGFTKEKTCGIIRWRGLELIHTESNPHWQENDRPF